MALAITACVAGNLAAGSLRTALFTGAFALLTAGLWIGWANGRRIEQRWRTLGVRGELAVASVSAVTKDRLSVTGTVYLPDSPPRAARFKAYVKPSSTATWSRAPECPARYWPKTPAACESTYAKSSPTSQPCS